MEGLKRKINLFGLTMIVIGSCIGSGIFITSNEVTRYLIDFDKVLLIWFLGGLVSLLGALTFAELGGLFPKSGGVYIYLRNGYGRLMGFLYGWIILFIVNTGAMAALSVAFADFMSYFFNIGLVGEKIIAVSMIMILTFINITGVNISQILANFFSSIKILAILFILFVGIIMGTSGASLFGEMGHVTPGKEIGISTYLLAFVGVFWSFGGWHHSTFLSGEVIKAQTTVPKAMIIGTALVTLLYLLANTAYFMLLPVEEIIASKRVAADAIASVFDAGGTIVTLMVMCSLAGTVAIYTMTAPRIYFAMAKDGLFFDFLTKIHPKFGTPYYAMLFQSVWAVLLILLWGSFVRIITFVVFMDIVFMMLAASTIFIFRNKIPEQTRPYKALGYPILPALYVMITAAFVVNLLTSLSVESFVGLGILLIGVVAYYFFESKHRK